MDKEFCTKPFSKRVEKPWGHEIIYTPKDALAVGKIIYVKAGHKLSLQYHDEKAETLCLIEGQAFITLSNEREKTIKITMEQNKGYFLQPGQIHRVEALTDITFIESSTPENGNTFRLEDDTNRPTETKAMRNNRG